MSKDFILNTSRGNTLRITVSGEEKINTAPCIICVHGFKGFKDWGFWPYTAEFLVKHGYVVLTFNFSHNGTGEKLTEFTEPDKFADNTFSLEVEELSELISAYLDNYFGGKAGNQIGLIGHSRGGGISLLTASVNSSVKAVAAWGSISKPDRYTERQKDEWREKGVFEVLNSRTNQLMRLNLTVLEDIEENKKGSLSIENAVKRLSCPLFIAQGEQDLTVPAAEAEQLYEWSDKEKTILNIIPSTGHTFGIVHPFEGSNQKFDYLLSETEQFFKTNFS